MKIELGETEETGIDLAPLIDCVFLLLIFFMVTASFRKNQAADDGHFELLLKLPIATTATQTQSNDASLVIALDSEGDTFLDGELIGRAVLHRRLEALAAENPNAHVRIEGDAAASHQQLVHVLDLCQFVGLWNVGVRTR